MQKEQIDDLLKSTLDDFRVSRGEKRILEGIVREHGDSEQQLGFLRHRAFAVARESITHYPSNREQSNDFDSFLFILQDFRHLVLVLTECFSYSPAHLTKIRTLAFRLLSSQT